MRALALTRRGLRRAGREWRLALLLWLTHFVVALIALAPVAAALVAALGESPEGDLLLDHPSLALVVDLLRQAPEFGARLAPALVAALAVAWAGGALLAGGVLEILVTDDQRPLLHRFGRGAGKFAGRFLRLGLVASLAALIAAALLAGPLFALRSSLETTGPEGMRLALGPAGLLVALAAMTAVQMALDLARVRIARDDRRDTMRALLGGTATLLRHPLRTFGVWGWNALGRAATFLLVTLIAGALGGGSVIALAALLLVQQAGFLLRAGLRVALWESEVGLVESLDRGIARPRP